MKLKKIKNISNKFDPLDKEIDDNKVVKEFCREYIKLLKELTLDVSQLNDDEDPTEFIIHKLDEYTPLRDEFITFFEEVLTHDNIDSEIIIKFLIDIFSLSSKVNDENYNPLNNAHYDFILKELFLYLISIALKSRNYYIIESIIHSPYYFEDIYAESISKTFTELDSKRYPYINDYLKRYYRYNHNKILSSGIGELINARLYKEYTMNDIVSADLLCCYISLLHADDEFKNQYWFPFTLPYYTKYYFDFFRKLDSKKYFEKVKGILNVEDIDELKERIILLDKFLNSEGFWISYRTKVKPIRESINLEDICTKR